MHMLDEWCLTARRVAIHLPTATAVAADLHLGYDRVRRRQGEALPVRSLAQELEPLASVIREHHLHRLVIAGDLFEDGRYQRDQLVEELQTWLAENEIELQAIAQGNHDRGLGKTILPVKAEGVMVGKWSVVHGDRASPEGPVVQGHEHPWVRWRTNVEGPCYLVKEDHLILPALSRDAAGVNVLGNPRWQRYRCCVIAGDQVLEFGEVGSLKRS
jgi:putative SbcD/Mre11-related phosphoesterase